MRIVYNGSDRAFDDATTVAQIVAEVADQKTGIAVALNGEVVRRADWETTVVRDADRLDVLTAVQGG